MLVAEVNYDAMKNLFYSPWLYLVIPFVNSQQTFKIPNDIQRTSHMLKRRPALVSGYTIKSSLSVLQTDIHVKI